MSNERTKNYSPTRDVLSVVTGVLVGPIGGVYEVLNWMTGESVFTHQLPRISREAQPLLVARHPNLQQAIKEAKLVTPDNWRGWLQTWEGRYGIAISVPQFTIDSHEAIDALSELAQTMHPDNIIIMGS